jgi:hypothetical protein
MRLLPCYIQRRQPLEDFQKHNWNLERLSLLTEAMAQSEQQCYRLLKPMVGGSLSPLAMSKKHPGVNNLEPI